MYVPAPPAQHALALAPVDIIATTPSLTAPPLGRVQSTKLHVRKSRLNVLDGRRVSVAGTLSPGIAGRRGSFALSYQPHDTGSRRVRLEFAGDALGQPAHRRLGRLNVYRLAEASWYGGGGGLACGGSLTSSTLGVANKTLPCGTLVTLRYNGRSVRVPVVDRGPYVAGREFDLTEATKQALGFGDTGEVWSTR
jgi:rare lipoprotein A